MQPFADKLYELFNSDTQIAQNVVLSDTNSWAYTLHRNSFALADIKGELSEVEIRCQNNRARYTAQADNVWSIPDSWGECRVHVRGAKSSGFEFIELSNQS